MNQALEIITALSSVVVAAAAVVALYQIRITVRTNRLNSKRESITLAATQCDRYLNISIPLQTTADHAIEGVKLPNLGKSQITFQNGRMKIKATLNSDLKNHVEIVGKLTLAFNSMESFAFPFTKGVADELAAFSSVGRTFYDASMRYLPLLVCLNQSGYYANWMHLFYLWYQRLENEKLTQEKLILQSKSEDLQDICIHPLGTTGIS